MIHCLAWSNALARTTEPPTDAPMRSAVQEFEVRTYIAVPEPRPAHTGRICPRFSAVNIREPRSLRRPLNSAIPLPVCVRVAYAATDNHVLPKRKVKTRLPFAAKVMELIKH